MSRNRVHLVAAQAVTALGDTLEATWEGLLEGRSGIGPVGRFPTTGFVSEVAALASGKIPEGVSVAAILAEQALDGLLADLKSSEAATGALQAADLHFATTKGAVDLLEAARREGREIPEAALPGALLHKMRERSGVGGRAVCVSAACASSTLALSRAAADIASGRSRAALVLCADMVSFFVFSGFSALRGLSPDPCRPFDRARNGLTLGEGAAALLLTDESLARDISSALGRAPLAELAGWGAAGDATHITAPDREGRGLSRAVQTALELAGIEPQDIAGINAHGTGTIYNDAMELTAFARIFEGRIPPLCSVKGALGHTMGAAGGIEAALAALSLRHRVLPPTLGLSEPEPGAGESARASLREIGPGPLLTTNSGFGGVNAALVLRPVETPGGTP